MRRFAQPNVIIKAVSTAAICVVLCLPRLATWKDLPNDLWFLAAMLGWCLFVLWGFVFAWEPKYGKATPFAIVREPRTWLLIPVAGAALGLFMHLFIDPDLKASWPKDYPSNIAEWMAQTLFALAFIQLFLCYAPLAFFARLIDGARQEGTESEAESKDANYAEHSSEPSETKNGPNTNWVIILTLGVNLFVLVFRLGSFSELLNATTICAFTCYRILATLAVIYLYRWSGVPAVSALVLTVQARHLFTLDH